MHYGVYLPNFGDYSDLRLLAELAHDAEVAGCGGGPFSGAYLPMGRGRGSSGAWGGASRPVRRGRSTRSTTSPFPRRRCNSPAFPSGSEDTGPPRPRFAAPHDGTGCSRRDDKAFLAFLKVRIL